MARATAQPLTAALGQPVLVETAQRRRQSRAKRWQRPDGYTPLVSFQPHHQRHALSQAGFDPVADFTDQQIATVPSLGRQPETAGANLNELIALAKSKPDAPETAIGGIGSSLHLAGDQFKMMADLRILNVPYKGTAPALTDVLGGQVDMMFISLVTGRRRCGPEIASVRCDRAQRQPSFRTAGHRRDRQL